MQALRMNEQPTGMREKKNIRRTDPPLSLTTSTVTKIRLLYHSNTHTHTHSYIAYELEIL